MQEDLVFPPMSQQEPHWLHQLPARRRPSQQNIFESADPLRAALKRVHQLGARSGSPLPAATPAVALAALPPQMRVLPPNAVAVVVIGCGRAGILIAGELLRRGCTVRLYDAEQSAREAAMQNLAETMGAHVNRELLLPSDVEALMARCRVNHTLSEVLCDGAQLIIEAIVEDVAVKSAFYAQVVEELASRGVSSEGVILGSNTMSVPLEDLTATLDATWAKRIVGVRMLFPCWFIDEIELTMGAEWCAFTGRGATQNATQPAYYEVERLLRSLEFRIMRNTGERRSIDAIDFELYEQRQHRQTAADREALARGEPCTLLVTNVGHSGAGAFVHALSK